MSKKEEELLHIDGHEVRISNPGKLYFSKGVQLTKLELVQYYLSVAPGALRGVQDRPFVLKRFVGGANEEPFYQKRAPDNLPEFVRTVQLTFPSGRTADEIVIDNPAALAWAVNLGCIELHPHPVRSSDLEHPDELRIDHDPQPGVAWSDIRSVAQEVRAVLDEVGLQAWPKTSGSRGIHVNVRIEPKWTFTEVRRAALALARAVERRHPMASSKWWKEERHGVFLDYNQNAKDRTTCSAYSVRPLPDARVSTPLRWDEVDTCDPADFTVATVPARFERIGDPNSDMDDHAGSLDALLEMADCDERNGIGDAPWPPHFKKQWNEGKRVQPSKAKKPTSDRGSEAESAETPEASEGATDQGASGETKAAPRGSAAKKRSATGRRQSTMPLIIIAQSPKRAAVDAGLERWKAAHPEAASHLAADDVLVDRMRGSAYIWYRIRVNLRNVPEDQRPAQGTPDPDDDPTRKWREGQETALEENA